MKGEQGKISSKKCCVVGKIFLVGERDVPLHLTSGDMGEVANEEGERIFPPYPHFACYIFLSGFYPQH